MSPIPEEYLDILNSTALAYIATIGPKGAPQVSAIWFGWNGSQLFFSMGKIRQKHRNLLRDPRVAVSITDPADPYRSLEIRGVARIDDDRGHAFARQLSQKYLQRDPTPEENPPQSERVVVMIEPERAIVFPPRKENG